MQYNVFALIRGSDPIRTAKLRVDAISKSEALRFAEDAKHVVSWFDSDGNDVDYSSFIETDSKTLFLAIEEIYHVS